MRTKKSLDPEQQRFYRKYPRFPGVSTYVAELHRHNRQGSYLDCLIQDFIKNAPTHIEELISALETESNPRVQVLLLLVMAEAKTPEFLPTLTAMLTAPDDSVRDWAIIGLKLLDTKEARATLWEARSYMFPTDEETLAFRSALDSVGKWATPSK